MKDPLNRRRYPQVSCSDSGDWLDQQGKLVATHAQMLAYYNHERAHGRTPHFVPRAATPKTAPAPKKSTASKPARSSAPTRGGKPTMSKASQAKAERDRLAATYSASELKAASQIMNLWSEQAKAGTLPPGFDVSIAHAIKIARQTPGVTRKESTGGVMVGSRFYVGGKPEDGAQ